MGCSELDALLVLSCPLSPVSCLPLPCIFLVDSSDSLVLVEHVLTCPHTDLPSSTRPFYQDLTTIQRNSHTLGAERDLATGASKRSGSGDAYRDVSIYIYIYISMYVCMYIRRPA